MDYTELLGKTVRILNLHDARGKLAKAIVEAVTIESPTLEITYRCWVYFAEVSIQCSPEQIEVIADELAG